MFPFTCVPVGSVVKMAPDNWAFAGPANARTRASPSASVKTPLQRKAKSLISLSPVFRRIGISKGARNNRLRLTRALAGRACGNEMYPSADKPPGLPGRAGCGGRHIAAISHSLAKEDGSLPKWGSCEIVSRHAVM
jgi:hypothetical protein